VEHLDHDRIVDHLRRVEADFARAITDHLTRREAPSTIDDHLAVAVTARTMAGATFAAMETWMVHGERTMAELSRLCHLALDQLAVRTAR
jgi:hypothetical protein